MSRTDAHAPHWVTATWWYPMHRDPGESSFFWRQSVHGRHHECDLPAEPVYCWPTISRWRAVQTTRCFWRPDLSHISPWPRPPRWYVEHVWHNPERVRVRDDLRAAAAEYRATGTVDTEPEPRQGRGSARWGW